MPITIADVTDAYNAIRNAYYQAFVDNAATGKAFEGFAVEKYQDPHEGFIAPGITLEFLPGINPQYGFGDHREWSATVRVHLIFKDNHLKTVEGGVKYYRGEAAEWYLLRVLDLLEETTFGAAVNETGRNVTGTVHHEQMENTNLFLWGCIAEVNVSFAGGVA